MPNYILVQIDELPHHSGDMDDIGVGIQTLLEATGINCEVNVMSSGQLFDHFNLIENPAEKSAESDDEESDDDGDGDESDDPDDH